MCLLRTASCRNAFERGAAQEDRCKTDYHSLSEMVNIISQALQRETPEQVIRCAVKLEKHYLASRYPDAAVSEYSKWDAEEAVEYMREVFKYVREQGEDL
ncbi:MAG: HEPN domain-containing protein [Candidatus Caldarchaeum sp.]